MNRDPVWTETELREALHVVDHLFRGLFPERVEGATEDGGEEEEGVERQIHRRRHSEAQVEKEEEAELWPGT